ncbi:hypothetical protein NHX12_017752 [Muraenolepis orangiensis]|uniref:SEA domain-containing protein n=1 Tax=Muraenolepis orangiensis TaxID=630683 RepID=A0A9Q0EYG8_9TELE|nr:hypothetical protein NHX12_017752 [Muraenolepis orangiensis]
MNAVTPTSSSEVTIESTEPKEDEGYLHLQFRINRDFIPAYNNPQSQEYKDLSLNVTTEVKL